jgi:uncharacterized protein (TIGR03083 family)
MEKPAPIITVHLFPLVLESLLDLLTNLTPAEWDMPTVSAGWTVKDIALHLLGDEVSACSSRRDGFSESGAPGPSWQELVAWLNASNEAWVRAARRISPQLLCSLLRFTGDQANAYFQQLDPYAIGRPVSWAGPEPAPVWLDIAREYTERWHHQQHIRDAVGKPGLIEPEFFRPVLDTFVYALPYTYRNVAAPDGTCVTLSILGKSGSSWSILREGERWQLFLGRPAQPAAEVTLPENVAWRLFTRGISREMGRKLASLQGDAVLGSQLLETVSIIA